MPLTDIRNSWRSTGTIPKPPSDDPGEDPVDDVVIYDDYWHVEAGDTVFAIAQAWGLSVDEVDDFNGLDDPNLIQVGQILVRPGTPVPTDDQHKDEIIAWLRVSGVDVDKKVKSRMTKSELLDLVEDLTDNETD